MPKSAFGLDVPGETPEDDPFGDAPVISDVAEAAPLEPESEDTGKDPLAPEEEPEPALDETPKTETPEPEPNPEDETEPALLEEEPEEEEVAAGTTYEGRYSTKYKTIEDYDEAHRNALDLGQRQAERARNAETQLAQATAYLEAAAAYIAEQEKKNAAPAPAPDLAADAAKYGVDTETLELARKIAAAEADSKIAPLQEQLTQQQQMQQLAQQQAELAKTDAETKSAIAAFRAATPDLDSDTETEIVGVFNEFGLDPTLEENYAIALEMANNAEFRSVLRANPTYVDTDDGLALARRLAGVKTVTKTKPKPRDLTDARKKATVESGSLGAPPAGEEADHDDWEDVLALATQGRKKSVFGV